MVLAAWTKRHPRRDHRGRRAPRPREPARRAVRARSSSPTRSPARRRKYRVVGRPIPQRSQRDGEGGGAAAVRPARRRAGARSSSARSPARAASTSSRRGVRRAPGRPCCTSRGERDYPSLRRPGRSAPTTSCCRSPTTSAPRSRRPTSSSRAPAARCGRSRPRARRRSSCRTRSRPPTTRRRTREYFQSARRRGLVQEIDLEAGAGARRRLLGGPRRGCARWRDAMRAPRGRTRRTRSRTSSSTLAGAPTDRPLAGRRIWIRRDRRRGLSSYALLAARGVPRSRGWDRVETPYLALSRALDITISAEPPRPPEGWEVSSRRRLPDASTAGRVPNCSPSSCRCAARSSSPARTARRRRAR